MTPAWLLLTLAAGSGADAPAITEPAWLRWGATQSEVARQAASLCTRHRIREIRPPFLTNVRVQSQIDCDGLNFWGGARRVEFVIGDDRLEMIWILVDPAELDRAGTAMRAAYGPPTAQRDDIIGYPEHRTALRGNPAEVLFYSPRQAAEWRVWFETTRTRSRPSREE